MEGADEGGIERVVDSKDLQQQSKALDKLTDRVEDRQLDSTRVQEVNILFFPFLILICNLRYKWQRMLRKKGFWIRIFHVQNNSFGIATGLLEFPNEL